MGKYTPDLVKHYRDTSQWPYITEENIEDPNDGCSMLPFRPQGCFFWGCGVWVIILAVAFILSIPLWFLQDVLHLIQVY